MNGTKFKPRQCIKLAIVGDDTLLTVKEGDFLFSGEKVKEIMFNVGYILTSARKDGSLLVTAPVETLSFLKRTFNLIGEHVFAPLSIKSIYKTLCYHLALNCTVEEWQRGVLLSTQREMFMYGKDEFEKFKAILKSKNIIFDELFYDELLNEYADGKFTTLGSLTMVPVLQLDIDVARF
jgi:hypothetical protein